MVNGLLELPDEALCVILGLRIDALKIYLDSLSFTRCKD